jgi:predicted lactoylglutathione lyase
MAAKIFVNLPVKDLYKTRAFFTQLGYSFNPQFTDDKAACMVISDDIYAMLLVEDFFKTFTTKEIVDAKKSVECLICLSADSRQAVDELISKAIAAGGSTYNNPQDHGFMYQHGFQDPDGHIWEIIWMDPATISKPQ